MTLEDEGRSNPRARLAQRCSGIGYPRRARQVLVTVMEVVALMNKEAGVAVVVPDDKQEQ